MKDFIFHFLSYLYRHRVSTTVQISLRKFFYVTVSLSRCGYVHTGTSLFDTWPEKQHV